MRTINFNGELLQVEQKVYNNGRIALQLRDMEGFPYMTPTVNIPTANLEEGETIIKNYSENEGILESLIVNEIVEATGKRIQSGFVYVDVVKVLI